MDVSMAKYELHRLESIQGGECMCLLSFQERLGIRQVQDPFVSVSHFLKPYIDKASVITTTNITKSLYYLRKEMGGE